MNSLYTIFAETQWPAVPSPYAAGVLAMLFQLEQTEWWSSESLAFHQDRQLKVLFDHAYATVPFYRERFDAIGLRTTEEWDRIPLLSRRDIQLAGANLHSTFVPKDHGGTGATTTGGSTGQPVTVITTDFTEFLWRVFTLRDHLWHGRDFSKSFAAIRHTGTDAGQPPTGTRFEFWGRSTENVIPTGPGFLLNIAGTTEEQAHWIRDINPGYLLCYPSALRGIAEVFETRGWRLDQLSEVITFGEVIEPEWRSYCERVFGVRNTDIYSSQEVGYIAFQCPDADHYHIQSENVLVEVLDDAGQACEAGCVGKVVVTTLHNFAMPLLRYDIGDYAEVGEPCSCGRGLPVLKRILGRQRNLLVMPNGKRRWPVFVAENDANDLPPFFQFQVVQRTVEEIDINVVRPGGVLTAVEHSLVERHFQQVLGYPFKITVNCVPEIPRSPTGKFEDFISLVN